MEENVLLNGKQIMKIILDNPLFEAYEKVKQSISKYDEIRENKSKMKTTIDSKLVYRFKMPYKETVYNFNNIANSPLFVQKFSSFESEFDLKKTYTHLMNKISKSIIRNEVLKFPQDGDKFVVLMRNLGIKAVVSDRGNAGHSIKFTTQSGVTSEHFYFTSALNFFIKWAKEISDNAKQSISDVIDVSHAGIFHLEL
jgi:hypothetical protein